MTGGYYAIPVNGQGVPPAAGRQGDKVPHCDKLPQTGLPFFVLTGERWRQGIGPCLRALPKRKCKWCASPY